MGMVPTRLSETCSIFEHFSRVIPVTVVVYSMTEMGNKGGIRRSLNKELVAINITSITDDNYSEDSHHLSRSP